MRKRIQHVLLVDDSKATNFFNKMMIQKTDLVENISIAENGAEALNYFDVTTEPLDPPEIVFLDLNMPVMDGWEFLDNYNRLDYINKNSIIILMLGTNLLEEDQKKMDGYAFIKGGSEKMLTKNFVTNLVEEYCENKEMEKISIRK